MDLKGNYATDKPVNPMLDMQLNIVIQGYDKDANDLLSCWHFDKHDPEDDEEETKFDHPEYHFTFGGRKMWDQMNLTWGASLILPTPRFKYPPMDGILGIDFVLGNYIKKERRHPITKLPEYKSMVKRSQARMWMPYYSSISNHWTKHMHFTEGMDLEKLIPCLIR